jgi:Kef-type K+ transport system membrane component KefB
MNTLLIFGALLFLGLLFGSIAKRIGLPKITGYLVAGVLLSPKIIPIVPENFVTHTSSVTNIALAFVTFMVGGTLHWQTLKRQGKAITLITLLEAECAFICVAIGFVVFFRFGGVSGAVVSAAAMIPLSILLAALASPTDPTATLAVADEYHAKGEVSNTIMSVAAFDDVLCVINFSVALVVARICLTGKAFDITSLVLVPGQQIFGGIATGIVGGLLFNWVAPYVHKQSHGTGIALVFAMLALVFGVNKYLGTEAVLGTMTLGCMVTNFNTYHVEIFDSLENYLEDFVFVIFFTISGMHLDFTVLKSVFLLVILFVLLRAAGKIGGTWIGATLAHASPNVRKYTSFGLLPQGGIVVGLALMLQADPTYSPLAKMLVSIVIGATVFHELLGPALAKYGLRKAGEII